MRARIIVSRRALGLGLVVSLAAGPVSSPTGASTQDIVNQVEQSSYRHYVEDLLYTHPGDNRGFGLEHDLAMANIFDTFESFGLQVYYHPFPHGGETYYNVVAVNVGLVRPEEHLVIGAHYDSADNPGADDNASGTAGVMEIARVLSQLDFESTIVFIAFDREEQGLYGSDAYAAEHAGDDIRGMISLDMIAYNNGNDAVDIYGRAASDGIKNSLAQAVADYGRGLDVAMHGAMDASDHAPFEWQGFEACLIIEDWGNPYYHTQNDHVEMPGYLDYAFATNVVRSVCGWLVDQAVPAQTCDADVDGDGQVAVADLLAVLSAWGAPCQPVCGPEDLDGSGGVDAGDFLAVLAAWGPCP